MTQVKDAQTAYDRMSHAYDALADASERKARSAGIRLLAPQGDERVLEVGFGTGHGLVDIADELDDCGRVVGADVSLGMLQVAEERVRSSELGRRVDQLLLADAASLPFAAGSFDAAFLSFTLELFENSAAPRVLHEIARVLRPSGRLAVVAMLDDGSHGPMLELYRFLHRHFPHLVDCRPIDACAYLAEAGFEVGATERLSIWGLPVVAVVAGK